MAIIDRVKKRVETDLDDIELQLIIDEVNQDVITKFGPHADPANPITVELEGWQYKIVLPRQIDTSAPITVVEQIDATYGSPTSLTLSSGDYRIWTNGYTLERRADGTNSRWKWGDRVLVTYTPVNDGDQRESVMVKLAILEIQYQGGFPGIRSQNVGDVVLSEADYQKQRESLMNSLAPRGGLFMA